MEKEPTKQIKTFSFDSNFVKAVDLYSKENMRSFKNGIEFLLHHAMKDDIDELLPIMPEPGTKVPKTILLSKEQLDKLSEIQRKHRRVSMSETIEIIIYKFIQSNKVRAINPFSGAGKYFNLQTQTPIKAGAGAYFS